ncbi:hypothetical protein HYPSUDRAFT_70069 [Hypholoma sublateritium FD-334 SS-4]|uniref:DUF6533 domain-containing protein n=1 Tax=Hypholoma sublateritium (strain FD-334 SS-4) TaxID=945553 RepID=A0A0D2NH50_HYPSF|nr:hypothetical protein HYPSUDRAFT_70069 [Hypholoma sublateritium FD-334 SS-4]
MPVAALIVILWDYLNTLSDEIRYIWTLRIDHSKVTYLASRYLSIAFQVVIVVITLREDMAGSAAPIPHQVCKRRHILQTISIYIIYALGNVNLMKRAYILHRRSKAILALLCFLTILEYAIATWLAPVSLNALVFDGRCNSIHVPWIVFGMLIPILCTQLAIWTLTYSKLQYGSISLNSINMFDGGKWTWLSLFALLLVFVPLSFSHQYIRPDLVYSWPITIMSVGTCRLVLRTEEVRRCLLLKQSHPQPLDIRHPPAPTGALVSAAPMRSDNREVINIPANEEAPPKRPSTATIQSDYNHSANVRDGLNSGTDHIEIGSVHTSSSVDSTALRAYWDDLWGARDSCDRSDIS